MPIDSVSADAKEMLGGLRLSDLRGMAQLAHHGTHAVTNMAQDMHQRIASPFGLRAHDVIAALAYQSVRGVSKWVARGVDAALGAIAKPEQDAAPHVGARADLISVLNGVCGDHLLDKDNPLAIKMNLLGAFGTNKKCVFFVHGLCLNDQQWRREAIVATMQELGYAPVFLRYNSGRRVGENGAELAALLQSTLGDSTAEVVVIAHSMGGLVMRSALQNAKMEGHRWTDKIRSLVFLGTPHFGAPLERAGHWVETIWKTLPIASALAPIAALRSAGIIDLRHGQTRLNAMTNPAEDLSKELAFPCFAIAASLDRASRKFHDRVMGDGLVPVHSALAQSESGESVAALPQRRCTVLRGVGHLELLHSPAVSDQLRQWLS